MDQISKDILTLTGVEESMKRIDKYYEYQGKRVPRVSNILAQCEDQRKLIDWAASMGYRRYNTIRDTSLEVGTIVHENIDNYLIAKYKNNNPYYEVEYDMIIDDYRNKVYNSFENFKLWESNLESLGCKIEEVVGLEIPVITPWYGGTIDAIFKINGAYYIIDFKTSKQISNSYLLQTAAYYYAVNNGYCTEKVPMMNGLGIIRLDKSAYGVIDDLFLSSYLFTHTP